MKTLSQLYHFDMEGSMNFVFKLHNFLDPYLEPCLRVTSRADKLISFEVKNSEDATVTNEWKLKKVNF